MTVRIITSALTNAINSAFKGEAQAVTLARVKQDKAIQQALDAMTLACTGSKAEFMKGNSASNSARGEVKAEMIKRGALQLEKEVKKLQKVK